MYTTRRTQRGGVAAVVDVGALRMLSPPSHFKRSPQKCQNLALPAEFVLKNVRLVDRDGGKEGVEAHQGRRGTGGGAARRRDRHRGRESRGGWDAEGGGSTPPLLAYLPPLSYLPFPPYHPLSKVSLLFS